MRQRESAAVIARDHNRLAGFILAQYGDESVHIALLGVANEYRRQGIGRQLVQWVEDTAKVAGLFLVFPAILSVVLRPLTGIDISAFTPGLIDAGVRVGINVILGFLFLAAGVAMQRARAG